MGQLKPGTAAKLAGQTLELWVLTGRAGFGFGNAHEPSLAFEKLNNKLAIKLLATGICRRR
jgi:hypothetical protein